ncbi:MAG: PAS domain-containing sensor histidine kinase [Deltaproteobacteria bacterium RBG_13_43_22]|nr:MAG: PAS domain-containing sensor histidine kinase [Deltaproteobacteria bacterium RBG_13_43_22]
MYVSSKEGKFLNANRYLLDMLGYESKEEFLNIEITKDLYVRPEDRDKFMDNIEQNGYVIDYEVNFKRKDGSLLPVLMTSHVRYDNENKILGYEGIMVDQSQRKQMEEEYKRLFENVGCGVFISTREGKFINANQALLDMLGYKSKEDFLNIDITKDLYARAEDRNKFMDMIEKQGHVIGYEVEFKRKDGTIIPVLLTGHVRYDQQGKLIGYEGINIDLSQRKQMEKELRETNDFLNNFIKSSPNAIMASDMKGDIFIWNKAAEEILEYKAYEVIGKMNIRKIYPEGVAQQVMKMLRSPDYGGIGKLRSYPMVYKRRDGQIIEGNLSAAIVYDGQGKEIASVGVFVDLKERLDMERKLRITQEQLLQSEKLAAMGRLTSQIAHELNNPLYGIMNTLELLKTEVSPQSKRRKILEMALSETVRLTELLRKMLSFSRPDEEEKQTVDINTIIDEILVLVKKQLQENGVTIASSFSPDLDQVFASKNQLRQVFLNLISNARDAMPEGGTLTVKTSPNKDNIHIEFTDTGIGIDQEIIEKIFDSFFTTKDSIKGVGLGLSVCYGFIKEHGGHIQVSSRIGEGTTFTITLPSYKENFEE